jgi:PmbA protein
LSVEEAIDSPALRGGGLRRQPAGEEFRGRQRLAQQSHFVSANSLGFMGGYPSSRHYLSCSVIAGEGDAMQRDDWYSTHRDAELAEPEVIGDYAARARCRAWARARSPPARCRCCSRRRWPPGR